MNIEELKLILETVNGISNSTVYVIILWILKGYLSTFLGWGVLFFAVRVVSVLVNNLLSSTRLNTIALELNDTRGYLTRIEADNAIKWMRLGKNKEHGQK